MLPPVLHKAVVLNRMVHLHTRQLLSRPLTVDIKYSTRTQLTAHTWDSENYKQVSKKAEFTWSTDPRGGLTVKGWAGTWQP